MRNLEDTPMIMKAKNQKLRSMNNSNIKDRSVIIQK